MSLEETAKKLALTPANHSPYVASFRIGRKAKLGYQFEMIDLSVERWVREGEDLHKLIRNELMGIDGIIQSYLSDLPLYVKRGSKQAPTVEVSKAP